MSNQACKDKSLGFAIESSIHDVLVFCNGKKGTSHRHANATIRRINPMVLITYAEKLLACTTMVLDASSGRFYAWATLAALPIGKSKSATEDMFWILVRSGCSSKRSTQILPREPIEHM